MGSCLAARRRPSQLKQKNVSSIEFAAILKSLATADVKDVRAGLSAAQRYHAALSISAFDVSTAYLLLVSAVETLAGHHYKADKFAFSTVEKFTKVRNLMLGLKSPVRNSKQIEKIQEELLRQEHFVFQKFKKFILNYLPDRFWLKDGLHPDGYGLPPIPHEELPRFIKKVYKARSNLAREGIPFPSYVICGASNRIPGQALLEAIELATSSNTFVPPFVWFERLTHCVIEEFFVRVIAPEVDQNRRTRAKVIVETASKISALTANSKKSFEQLTKWTAQYLGTLVVGPMAPNPQWAVDLESIAKLESEGLIRCDSSTWEGSSCLKDRLVGEAAGEVFWSPSDNPFRGNEILERPKNQKH